MPPRRASDDNSEPHDDDPSQGAQWQDDSDWEDDRDGADGEFAGDSDEETTSTSDSQLAYCPDCKAEIYDASEICPKCSRRSTSNTSRFGPQSSPRRDSVRVVVAWALIAVLVLGAGVWSVLTALG